MISLQELFKNHVKFVRNLSPPPAQWTYVLAQCQNCPCMYLCLHTLFSNSSEVGIEFLNDPSSPQRVQTLPYVSNMYAPYKCVSFVLEDANLLNGTKMCECLLQ